MTAPTAHPPVTSRRLLVAILVAAAVLAGVLALSDGSAPSDPPDVTPLRVTAGTEIATGFAVGGDRVVTVAHVLGGALKVSGTRARVIRVDRRTDLALLAVRGVSGRAPTGATAGAGDELRVLRLRSGRSSSLSARVRRPIIAHVRAPRAERAVTRPALELAARVVAGDSGAPVVSRSGALAGVIFAASSRREDTAYAVDASAVTRLLARD
jgi:S1-C subfamily serine protease